MRPLALIVYSGENSPDKNQMLLGLTISDRFRLTAKKAGLSDFCWLDPNESFPPLPESFVAVSADILPSVSLLKRLASTMTEPESVHRADSSAPVFVIRTKDTNRIARMFRPLGASGPEIDPALKTLTFSISAAQYISLNNGNFGPAERYLLNGLIKENEGFMSRHLERKISLAVTRLVSRTSLTPNQMTVVSASVGLAGALLFLTNGRWSQFTGAMLFWLHSVLDGCDGELARLKFMESRWGGLLDFWTDNLVHIAVFACIAVGLYRGLGQSYPIFLGASAVLGTAFTASFVYLKTMHTGKTASGPVFTSVMENPVLTAPSDRVMDFLARRDFIYLVLILSFFQKAEWFLWMSAVGAPLYLAVLVAMHGKKVK